MTLNLKRERQINVLRKAAQKALAEDNREFFNRIRSLMNRLRQDSRAESYEDALVRTTV